MVLFEIPSAYISQQCKRSLSSFEMSPQYNQSNVIPRHFPPMLSGLLKQLKIADGFEGGFVMLDLLRLCQSAGPPNRDDVKSAS